MQRLYLMTLPTFPTPHPKLVEELRAMCGKDENEKCVFLYDYLGKIMVFEKKLRIFKEGMLKDV